MHSFVAALLALAITLGSVAMNLRLRDPDVAGGDTPAYLVAAYNLARHGVFAEAPGGAGAPPLPALGREPGYAVFLSGLLTLPTRFAAFTPECLRTDTHCDPGLWRPAQRANLVLGLLAAAAAGATGWLLTASMPATLVAFGYVALNQHAFRGRHYLLSDYLALALVALTMLLLVAWWRDRRLALAIVAGLAGAALILTKAVFLWLLLPAALSVCALSPWRAGARRALPVMFAAILPVALWMLRNQAIGGGFVLTDARSGIALSTREMFNHMDWQQIACGFVFWTRGFGDGLAASLFPPAIWQPFQLDWPGGYYDVGQHRYAPWVARLVAEQGMTVKAATAAVDRTLLGMFAARPLGFVASYPVLFWRGLWIDEFVVIGLPALIAAMVAAFRARHGAWLLALLPGVFSLIFYPAISLNIPRYQLVALPAFALATACLCCRLTRGRTTV